MHYGKYCANMYCMSHSATNVEPGLRERKWLATRDSLVEAARALSSEHGFSHFTIEQLCEQVGVSRRTFFNYFPTKEDAFLGQENQGIPTDVAEEFVRKGASSPAGTISPGLFDDMAEVLCTLTESMPFTREAFEQMLTAIEKDPKLLEIILRFSDRREAAFRELVACREGIDPTDARAEMAAALLTAVAHRTVVEFFRPDNTRTYREVLTSHVAAVKALFQTSAADPDISAVHEGPQ
jgi:AcrR family transcriptional regulator